MPFCAARNCSNRLRKGCGKTFHKFPRDAAILKVWLKNMKRDGWSPSPYSSLCSDHFEEKCFDRTGQTTRLRSGVVPTLFNFPVHLKKNMKHQKLPFRQGVVQPVSEVKYTDLYSSSVEKEVSMIHSSGSEDECVSDNNINLHEETELSKVTTDEEQKSVGVYEPKVLVEESEAEVVSALGGTELQHSLSSRKWLNEIDTFNAVVVQAKVGSVVLRTNVRTEDDATKWITAYEKAERTKLKLIRSHKLDSFFRRTYMCHHGDISQSGKKKFTGCKFQLDLRVTPVTKDTIRQDHLRQQYPCFITLKGDHVHSVKTPNPPKEERQFFVQPDTMKQFFKYFNLGMTTVQAIKFHKEKVEVNLLDLSDQEINPSTDTVAHLRKVWLRQQRLENAESSDCG